MSVAGAPVMDLTGKTVVLRGVIDHPRGENVALSPHLGVTSSPRSNRTAQSHPVTTAPSGWQDARRTTVRPPINRLRTTKLIGSGPEVGSPPPLVRGKLVRHV